MAILTRIGRYSGPSDGNRFKFSGGDFGPYVIVDLQSYTNNGVNFAKLKLALRSNPYGDIGTLTSSLDGSPSVYESFLDGNWHKIGVRLKMNSEAGVSDGEAQLYYDSSLLLSDKTIEWNTQPEDNGLGWNQFIFGGNSHNVPYPEEDKFEQWYALDDFSVWEDIPSRPESPGNFIKRSVNP